MVASYEPIVVVYNILLSINQIYQLLPLMVVVINE
jgi:hypothetical protein